MTNAAASTLESDVIRYYPLIHRIGVIVITSKRVPVEFKNEKAIYGHYSR